jgi:lipopolysaccharide/colanic/teichoic acid biosynthesis glycosyltransferase
MRFTSWWTLFKRALDVLVSACLLIASSPVLVLSAILIRLTSPGPVLFRQSRMGRDFKTFQIVKLRTMAYEAGGSAYTLGHDPRITPIGQWLRRTKIDELPQLWNVLRGEMSLVGPRPVIPELTREFYSEYSILLRARPGLTDPASLKYSQEASLLQTVPEPLKFFKAVVTPDKLAISLDYMAQATLWTDLKTIAMTGVICCYPAMNRFYGSTPMTHGNVARAVPELALDDLYVDFGERVTQPGKEAPAIPERTSPVRRPKPVLPAAVPPWILLRNPSSKPQSASNRVN